MFLQLQDSCICLTVMSQCICLCSYRTVFSDYRELQDRCSFSVTAKLQKCCICLAVMSHFICLCSTGQFYLLFQVQDLFLFLSPLQLWATLSAVVVQAVLSVLAVLGQAHQPRNYDPLYFLRSYWIFICPWSCRTLVSASATGLVPVDPSLPPQITSHMRQVSYLYQV